MPGIALLFAAAALTVKPDGAVLRSGCESGDAEVARLAAGTTARVRYAINGCYAVEVTAGEGNIRGFVRAAEVSGVEAMDQLRREAASVDTPAGRSPVSNAPGEPVNLARLFENHQPAEALALLERALAQEPRNPRLLALAGLAAYRSDRIVLAAGYLRDSLALQPDAEVERLFHVVERERNADRTGEPLHSPRFQFRFDPSVMPRDTARALLGTLEQEYTRIAATLGCRTAERLAVIAQGREDYLRSTGAAEWSGGQFDGRIRVAVFEDDPGGPATRRALAHEIVHACLAGSGNWPAWLHEGLAQRLSGDSLGPARRSAILQAAQANKVPRLELLSQSWSRTSSGHAALAYATALFAVELFFEHHAEFGIRNLLRSPEQLPRIAADLDRRIAGEN